MYLRRENAASLRKPYIYAGKSGKKERKHAEAPQKAAKRSGSTRQKGAEGGGRLRKPCPPVASPPRAYKAIL